ncbi:MAG: thioredoxin family protein [Myxococcota bacterium]|nr:thioredoxin family protein [Myxococcota bacterium]
MGLLKEKDKATLKKNFEELQTEVKLVMFTQETECEYCSVTRQMVEELAELSGKIALEVRDFVKDADVAKKLGIDKIPAIAVIGEKDYGIRFYGIPAGYEFTTLVEGILDVSRGDPGLSKDVLKELAKVDKPVHMQAMISPTCPYCPKAVRTAHRFAMASEHIRGDMVEISEFPHLAVKYNVQGVPNTIINEKHSIVGGQPEMAFAKAVIKAVGK